MKKLTLPKIIGHCGAASHAPENTIPSIREAYNLGAKIVEIDAMLLPSDPTAPVVVFHDEELDRTTNATGLVKDITFNEIRGLDAGSWFDTKFKGVQVPTLTEIMDECKALGLSINIEIKPCFGYDIETAHAIADTIKNHSLSRDSIILSSFSRASLKVAQQRVPDITRGLCIEGEFPLDVSEVIKDLGLASIALNKDEVTDAQIKLIKSQGVLLLAYTIDDLESAIKICQRGIDSIFTNDPKIVSEAAIEARLS